MLDRASVKSAQRVLEILQLFARRLSPATLGEVTKELGIPKSSCLALLQTLQIEGFIHQFEADGRYYPTGRWLALAQRITEHEPVAPLLRPILLRIREACGETVCLAKRSKLTVLYLDVVESEQVLHYSAEAGQMRPLHCSASGQALLAGMDAYDREAIIEQLTLDKVAPNSITDRATLRLKVAEAAARGWSSNVGEFRADTAGVAVPLRVHGSIYAIVVAGPVHRLADVLPQTADIVLSACRALHVPQ